MFYDDNIKNYSEINYKINKLYCDKYNIDLIVSNTKKYKSRHPAWERLPLILDNIKNYDYVMWIDADAFFYNDANNIIELINNYSDYNFIFSSDIKKYQSNINSGFIIIKNTEYSIHFLKLWAFDEELYKKNTRKCYLEQGVLQDMHRRNILNIQNNCIILEYGILQHYKKEELETFNNKPYIYHLAGSNTETRFNESNNYYNNLRC